MMEQRRALSTPFVLNKDNTVKLVSRSPLKGCKFKRRDSPHKNGNALLDQAAVIALEMNRRKPRLVLRDVLKTEQGKRFLERIKLGCVSGRRGLMSVRGEGGQCGKEGTSGSRSNRFIQKEERQDNRTTPKRPNQNHKSSPSTAQRLTPRRKLELVAEEQEKDEVQDIQEEVIGKPNGADYKFAEVVDCGLSVSWEPGENTGSSDEFSPSSIKDRWTNPEVQHSLRRKRMEPESQHNGTGSPKRRRASVLRLTVEDGGVASAATRHEDCLEDRYLDMLDSGIVQFTVGEDDTPQVLVPVTGSNLSPGPIIDIRSKRLSTAEEAMMETTGSSEPIVLSSDEEESGNVPEPCGRTVHLVHSLAAVEDELMQRQMSVEATTEAVESALKGMDVLRVVVEDLPPSMSPSPIHNMDSCLTFGFYSLYCGGYSGKANGNFMIGTQNITIPLRDTSEQVAVELTFERDALRRYSVWEEQEMEMRYFRLNGDDEPLPCAILLLCLSDAAAAVLQHDLCKLGEGGTDCNDKASPFILLTLKYPLEGMEGALLRSSLDIDCLNGCTLDESVSHAYDFLDDPNTPVLSLDDSLELIKRTEPDSHLLRLLGLDADEDGSDAPYDESGSPQTSVDVEAQSDAAQLQEEEEAVAAAEQDEETQLYAEEKHEEQEPEQPPEKKDEPTPVYTLCHCRTKGSYSVSMCKPDSSWTKYKHQGLAHRLIQFPPPPLKGGITVTMEDLECLDSRQFLNDVIIDFYLKYLLHNAPAAVAERSHIFSSFFYKQLTRRDVSKGGNVSESCQRQRRHQRVKTWTRHVDIFNKDFLFVPVNQESHWYLVVICFPGLEKPTLETRPGSDPDGTDTSAELEDTLRCAANPSPNHDPETPPVLNHSDSGGTESEKPPDEPPKPTVSGPVNCTEQTFQRRTVCKRPCILVMDSLKLSLHERVVKLLRDYLQSEWEVRRGSTREFGPDQMKSSHCQVPLQDNSSDCGLYLLQYVESFLKDPVVHFDLPLQLQRWFPRQTVRRKRDEIRDLILYLYRKQNLDNR